MNACPYSPDELLPHAQPMVLLDRVLEWDAQSIATGLTIGPSTRFLDPGHGIPAHVGLEWMAQACGLFAGLEAKAQNEPVRLGFLLGTRRYQSARPYFPEGASLTVAAQLVLREGGMAVFDCRIVADDGSEEAAAQLTVYQPEDAESVLANHTSGE